MRNKIGDCNGIPSPPSNKWEAGALYVHNVDGQYYMAVNSPRTAELYVNLYNGSYRDCSINSLVGEFTRVAPGTCIKITS